MATGADSTLSLLLAGVLVATGADAKLFLLLDGVLVATGADATLFLLLAGVLVATGEGSTVCLLLAGVLLASGAGSMLGLLLDGVIDADLLLRPGVILRVDRPLGVFGSLKYTYLSLLLFYLILELRQNLTDIKKKILI